MFDMSTGHDCSPVFEASGELLGSFILCAIGFIAMFVFSIITCSSVCCPAKCCGYANAEEEANAAMAAKEIDLAIVPSCPTIDHTAI